MKANILQSFKYVASGDAVVLILGSMPGGESLRKQQYYAHPRNMFWTIMSEILGFDHNLSYNERLMALRYNKIALWDVVYQCRRKGSLDSNIEELSLKVNDFSGFFQKYRTIHSVFFNGKKAEDLFNRNVFRKEMVNSEKLNYCILPSTSPANASMSKNIKLERWMKVREAVLNAEI